MDTGTALVGAFGRGSEGQQTAVMEATGPVRIDIRDTTPRDVEGETVSDFRANQVVFRAEFRRNIAVGMPDAFVYLTSGS